MFRDDFEISDSIIYLNSANLSICPRSVGSAIERYRREFELNPTRGLSEAWGKLWKVQSELAEFLNARPTDLFLRQNVTTVLNQVVMGTPLPANSEILVGELEYGSIMNVCRLRAEQSGLNWRILKMPQSQAALRAVSDDSLCEHIVSQLHTGTKLLLLSHVIAGTGLVLPIEKIARETRRRGITFVVDGAYAPGALPVDFARYDDIDFYGCSLYKWMLGPKGTAFGWVNPRHQETLRPITAGWTTFDTHGPFAAFGGSNTFQQRFLMSGCHDFAPFFALHETLAYWNGNGAPAIQARLADLRKFLFDEIQQQFGWTPLTSGPMLIYRLPENLVGKNFLTEFKIQVQSVAMGETWHASFSPHVYNTEEELKEAVRRIKGLTRL